MNISIIGASGFVGRNLVKKLLEETDHNIFAFAPDVSKINIEDKHKSKIELIELDVFNVEKTEKLLKNSDVAFYFVHMLDSGSRFFDEETKAAEIIGKTLRDKGVKKVIYMSGLGCDSDKLSDHLASRHNTGRILRKHIDQVIEFRASMIIGEDSASFEIVRDIIHKSPIVLLPNKADTLTQPIGLGDALLYLVEAINLSNKEHQIVEIGGPEKMSYVEMLKKYKNKKNKKTIILRLPFLPGKIAGWFLYPFTSLCRAKIGNHMIDSFRNEMIVTDDKHKELFPSINPKPVENYF